MKLFKESEVKKMLGYVSAGQMSFSRMVELMNEKVYTDKAKKGDLTTYMDVVRCLEAFLGQNENCKNQIRLKFESLKSDILKEVLESAFGG